MPTPLCAARRPQAEAAGLLWGAYHFGTGQIVGRAAGGVLPGRLAAGPTDPAGPRPRGQRKQSVELHDARTGRGVRAGGGPGDGPAADRLRASDLGQRRSAARLRPQPRRPDHAGLDPRALRPVGRRLPRFARDPAAPGRRAAGGSGSMPATRVRAARPTARPPSCRASATAIATCSTATRPRSIVSGAPATELGRMRRQRRGMPGSPYRSILAALGLLVFAAQAVAQETRVAAAADADVIAIYSQHVERRLLRAHVDRAAATISLVPFGPPGVETFAVAPNGAFIVTSATRDQGAGTLVTYLFLLDEAGHALGEPLRSPVGAVAGLAISPKGDRIAASSNRGWLALLARGRKRPGATARGARGDRCLGRPAVHLCLPPGRRPGDHRGRLGGDVSLQRRRRPAHPRSQDHQPRPGAGRSGHRFRIPAHLVAARRPVRGQLGSRSHDDHSFRFRRPSPEAGRCRKRSRSPGQQGRIRRGRRRRDSVRDGGAGSGPPEIARRHRLRRSRWPVDRFAALAGGREVAHLEATGSRCGPWTASR